MYPPQHRVRRWRESSPFALSVYTEHDKLRRRNQSITTQSKQKGQAQKTSVNTVRLMHTTQLRICRYDYLESGQKEDSSSSLRSFVGHTFSLEHLSGSGKEASSNLTQLSTSAKDKVDTYGCKFSLRSIFFMASVRRGELSECGYIMNPPLSFDSADLSDVSDSGPLEKCASSVGRSGKRSRGMMDKVEGVNKAQ
jgi:hypothetical protein